MGALIGGVVGRKVDIGLPDDFVRQVSAQLKPQSSALVLLVTSANKQVLLPQLQEQGGAVLSNTLDPESDAKLEAALGAGQAPD